MTEASWRFDNRLERVRAGLIFALSVTLFGVVAQAQQPSTTENAQAATAATPAQASRESPGQRRVQAVRVTEAIKIDGRLDETSWSMAQAVTDFRQEEPTEGAPDSEKT